MSRTLPIALLVLATLFSGGSAWAVNLMIGSYAAVEGAVQSTPVAKNSSRRAKARSATPRALTVEQYLDGIMRRNLFDKDVISTWNPNPKGDSDTEARSELKVRLLGTIVASPESFSSALIADEEDPYPRGYSIGDELHNREVIKIEVKQVTLKRLDNGEIELLTIDDTLSAAPRASAPKPSSGGEDGAVQEAGDNKYTVSRDLFDKYINDLEGISRMGRALLHRGPDGEFDGYRLSAIRRNTLADQLGIKNGDIIHAVNGQSLDSVQAAMGAYNTLKTDSNFCFEITRRGSPVELCYDVQ
ncbi:MAG: hypothetical protein KTR31_01185 [Myxococcales bacterium]|nr:hypothetical protein [Myxococcales bacterium]